MHLFWSATTSTNAMNRIRPFRSFLTNGVVFLLSLLLFIEAVSWELGPAIKMTQLNQAGIHDL
ncbi:hypothetical protein FHK02_5904 [Spirosoma sp. LMG 31448]|uniref:Uncharacterized protein n=1 Tax=Spirosoma utsteinense TaxID=2585773 RepID=A0ABR6WGQ9_9BACT|nr:hypothetical protein [Spirosoma utsteinense]MBC3795237.1 hypothetical protein [Spirosoma utsteinense]